MRECVDRLSNVVSQIEVVDQLVWELHSSKRYTVEGIYNNLTAAEIGSNVDYQFVLWIKVVSLKVNIFESDSKKDNLFRRHILAITDMQCSSDCGCSEDRKHLFFHRNFFSRLWSEISALLDFSMAHHGNLGDHLYQFGD